MSSYETPFSEDDIDDIDRNSEQLILVESVNTVFYCRTATTWACQGCDATLIRSIQQCVGVTEIFVTSP